MPQPQRTGNARGDGEGAEGAAEFDALFRELIAKDPDIQAVIKGVWGEGPRPSDTPKNLEQANHQASKQIEEILRAKGIDLPDRTFINPRSGTIEGHRGWSGMSGWQRAATIAALGAAVVATGGAAGVIGGGGGAGAGAGGGLGVTSGMGSLAGVGATGVGAGAGMTGVGAAAGGAGMWGSLLSGAGGYGGLAQTGLSMATGAANRMGQQRDETMQFQAMQDNVAREQAKDYENAQQQRARLDIDQKTEARQALNDAYQNALRSSLTMNQKDVSIERPRGVSNVSFANSARPSSVGPQGRQAAETLNRSAMESLLNPHKPSALPPIERPRPTVQQSSAGFWENLLAAGGAAGTAYETLQRGRQGPTATATDIPIGSWR